MANAILTNARGPSEQSFPQVRHVNLMVDTIITNIPGEDIRAVVRALLSTSPAVVTDKFCSLAKDHLSHVALPAAPTTQDLFTGGTDPAPTPLFEATLARARARYGAGLGASSIRVLLPIVDIACSIKWEEGSLVEEALSIVDCDISAALLNAKEEIRGDGDAAEQAKEILRNLRRSLTNVEQKVAEWGGEHPFERSVDALDGILV